MSIKALVGLVTLFCGAPVVPLGIAGVFELFT